MPKRTMVYLQMPTSFSIKVSSDKGILVKEVSFSHESICAIGYFYESPQKYTEEVQTLIDFLHKGWPSYKDVKEALRYSAVYQKNETYITEEQRAIERSSPYLKRDELFREALICFATNHFSTEMNVGMKISKRAQEEICTVQPTPSPSEMITYKF